MVPIRSHIVRSSDYLCLSCLRCQNPSSASLYNSLGQRRFITQKYLAKTAQAADWWCEQAGQIRAGKKQSILSTLEQRGYVNSVVGSRDDLDRLITSKRVGVYLGIDPTAPSLHVGHLLPLMALFRMYIDGIHIVALLGGATARVGDPSGRTSARNAEHPSVRKANMANMHIQLKMISANIEQYVRKYNYNWEWAWRREIANNNAWLNKLEIAEVLRLLGSGLRIGTMLGKETVRKRMASGDGMSLGEFLYPVLQSWDWWHMYHTKGIQVQIGGTDQYGNILSGIESIKYINKNHYNPVDRQEKEEFLNTPMGFTIPLLTSASGEKFGKSLGNAIWLDKDMTNVFDQYQFFLRTSDADVSRYLKLFTFMPIDQIEALVESHSAKPSERLAQHRLAYEVIAAIHGVKLAAEAQAQHNFLFSKAKGIKSADDNVPTNTDVSKTTKSVGDKMSTNTDVSSVLNPSAPHATADNMPSAHLVLPKTLVYNQPISRLLHSAGLVSTPSEGHRLANKKAAYIGSRPGASGTMSDQVDYTPVANWNPKETEKFIIDGDLLILRVGKWKVKIIKIISDQEFVQKGLTAPGWKEKQESIREKNPMVQWERNLV